MKSFPQFFALLLLLAAQLTGQTASRRPMTFMDVINMRSVGSPAISPDGQWMLYTLSTPDWKSGKSFTNIHLVPLREGFRASRQMTFTKEKNESSPQWSRDSRGFAFLSNREAPDSKASLNQLYYMRIDGGEAVRISDASDGVGSFSFSKDGRWIAYSAGKEDFRQLWIIPTDQLTTGTPRQLTRHPAGIGSWRFAPNSTQMYFIAADSIDKPNRDRKEKKFDVRVRNEIQPIQRLWSLDPDSGKIKRLTSSDAYSVDGMTMSDDSRWIGFRGIPNDRYIRGTVEASDFSDLYLLDVASGTIERLTSNIDIGESGVSFSPDNTLLAFSSSDDFQYFRNDRIYVRHIAAHNTPPTKLGSDFDGDLSITFWSPDSRTIYSNVGIRSSNQLMAVSIATGTTAQVTAEPASTAIFYDPDAHAHWAAFSSPTQPMNYYWIPKPSQFGKFHSWIRLTDSNPQADSIQLGTTEAIEWTSTDGKRVEGIVVKPVGCDPARRYPLIVQIHGGPAGAVTLGFNANYGNYSHVYAGAGYACFLPNYRGSTNYGERHKMEIGGDYFRQGYDDIMTGVDHLIRIGLADSAALGSMGWSAGGHWSNWILTHTDRFKAISSGAGAVNWTSMYAQTDVQRNREFYFGGKPYDRFEHYWNESPLKYIANARTPTLIQVVDGDPRVPRPQSDELHMALRKLGVPTEYLVYPGTTHGLTELRHQLIKMTAEFHWFERWLRGASQWFDWNDLLSTLKDEKEPNKER